MGAFFGKICPALCAGLFFCLTPASVLAHPNLNGTWVMKSTQSDFAGEPVIQTGTVTINERQHNISISRSFDYDGKNNGFVYNFVTDGRVNSTIKEGTEFRSKAKWEGNELVVTTTREGLTTVEHYALMPSGELLVTVNRSDGKVELLRFERR